MSNSKRPLPESFQQSIDDARKSKRRKIDRASTNANNTEQRSEKDEKAPNSTSQIDHALENSASSENKSATQAVQVDIGETIIRAAKLEVTINIDEETKQNSQKPRPHEFHCQQMLDIPSGNSDAKITGFIMLGFEDTICNKGDLAQGKMTTLYEDQLIDNIIAANQKNKVVGVVTHEWLFKQYDFRNRQVNVPAFIANLNQKIQAKARGLPNAEKYGISIIIYSSYCGNTIIQVPKLVPLLTWRCFYPQLSPQDFVLVDNDLRQLGTVNNFGFTVIPMDNKLDTQDKNLSHLFLSEFIQNKQFPSQFATFVNEWAKEQQANQSQFRENASKNPNKQSSGQDEKAPHSTVKIEQSLEGSGSPAKKPKPQTLRITKIDKIDIDATKLDVIIQAGKAKKDGQKLPHELYYQPIMDVYLANPESKINGCALFDLDDSIFDEEDLSKTKGKHKVTLLFEDQLIDNIITAILNNHMVGIITSRPFPAQFNCLHKDIGAKILVDGLNKKIQERAKAKGLPNPEKFGISCIFYTKYFKKEWISVPKVVPMYAVWRSYPHLPKNFLGLFDNELFNIAPIHNHGFTAIPMDKKAVQGTNLNLCHTFLSEWITTKTKSSDFQKFFESWEKEQREKTIKKQAEQHNKAQAMLQQQNGQQPLPMQTDSGSANQSRPPASSSSERSEPSVPSNLSVRAIHGS